MLAIYRLNKLAYYGLKTELKFSGPDPFTKSEDTAVITKRACLHSEEIGEAIDIYICKVRP